MSGPQYATEKNDGAVDRLRYRQVESCHWTQVASERDGESVEVEGARTQRQSPGECDSSPGRHGGLRVRHHPACTLPAEHEGPCVDETTGCSLAEVMEAERMAARDKDVSTTVKELLKWGVVFARERARL